MPDTSDPAPGPVGRPLTVKQFWELMERWGVDDPVALELIGFAGKIGKAGKRPRFRFLPHHQRVTTYLAEIDAALTTIREDGTWLVRKQRSPPFGRQTPLAFMLAKGLDGMDETLRFLHRSVWRMALKK